VAAEQASDLAGLVVVIDIQPLAEPTSRRPTANCANATLSKNHRIEFFWS